MAHWPARAVYVPPAIVQTDEVDALVLDRGAGEVVG